MKETSYSRNILIIQGIILILLGISIYIYVSVYQDQRNMNSMTVEVNSDQSDQNTPATETESTTTQTTFSDRQSTSSSTTNQTQTWITSFGADSGLSDNAPAINEAMASSSHIVIPPGLFKIQSSVRLRNGVTLEGTRGTSRIIIDDTFVHEPYFLKKEFVISNEHLTSNFDNETADTFTIRGVTFVLKTTKSSIQTILGLANVKNVIIEDCDFIVENSNAVGGNNLDLYAACQGVTIRNCYFKNDTGADEGCNIQIRCSSENIINETCDILIENNTFDKNGNDEVLAVYGWNGRVRNVTVRNNVIRTYGNVPNLIISVFTGETTSTLKDIFITGNQITTDNVRFTVFLIGRDGDSTRMFDNVRITGNTIEATVKSMDEGNTFIIFSGRVSNKTNILIEGNTIVNTGSYPLKSAIYGPSDVSNNIIDGLFNASINHATRAYRNIIKNNTAGSAIANTSIDEENVIINWAN